MRRPPDSPADPAVQAGAGAISPTSTNPAAAGGGGRTLGFAGTGNGKAAGLAGTSAAATAGVFKTAGTSAGLGGLGRRVGLAGGTGAGLAPPGFGRRGGSRPSVLPGRLPGIAGARTFGFLSRSSPAKATSGCGGMMNSGTATGTAHCGQAAVGAPPGTAGTSQTAAQDEQDIRRCVKGIPLINYIFYNFHYF